MTLAHLPDPVLDPWRSTAGSRHAACVAALAPLHEWMHRNRWVGSWTTTTTAQQAAIASRRATSSPTASGSTRTTKPVARSTRRCYARSGSSAAGASWTPGAAAAASSTAWQIWLALQDRSSRPTSPRRPAAPEVHRPVPKCDPSGSVDCASTTVQAHQLCVSEEAAGWSGHAPRTGSVTRGRLLAPRSGNPPAGT